MNIPFTIDQFLQVIRDYNLSVWPMQIVFYAIGFLVVFFGIRRTSRSTTVINFALASLWLWAGIVYHIGFFTGINKAAYLFGGLSIVQGILFLYSGVFKNSITYAFRPNLYGWTGLLFIVYALVIYPVIGYFSGHSYPYAPTFGLPCPTTIFTMGMLLFADKKISLWILAVPLFWSIVGTSAALNFGIWEDLGLLVSGITTLVLITQRNKKLALKKSPAFVSLLLWL